MTKTPLEIIRSGDVLLEGSYKGPVTLKGGSVGEGSVKLQIFIAGPRHGLNNLAMSATNYRRQNRSMELINGQAPPTPRRWSRLQSAQTPSNSAGRISGKVEVVTRNTQGDKIKLLQYFTGSMAGTLSGPVQSFNSNLNGPFEAQSRGKGAGLRSTIKVNVVGEIVDQRARGEVSIEVDSAFRITFDLKNRYRLGDVGKLGIKGNAPSTEGGPKEAKDKAFDDMLLDAAEKAKDAVGFFKPSKDNGSAKRDGFVDGFVEPEPGGLSTPTGQTEDTGLPVGTQGSGVFIDAAAAARAVTGQGDRRTLMFPPPRSQKPRFSTAEKAALGVAGIGAVSTVAWFLATR